MRKLCIGICLLALTACRKDPVHVVAPVAGQEPKDSVTKPADGPFNGLLDLEGISFTPSVTPMSFVSRAYGRKQENGYRPEILLSSTGWTHPSVLHLNVPWNGYSYWMAITPYPNTDNQFENPHIFCSNDGVNWKEPAGITNPIEPCPDSAYNSDVNLMLDNNMLYCYFRMNGTLSGRAMYVLKSNDGVHWSPKELVCTWPVEGIDVIAPSVIKDGNLFRCYGVSTGEAVQGNYYSNYAVRQMVSDNPVTGFRPVKDTEYKIVGINGRPWGMFQDPWHLEVQKLNDLWLILITTTNHGGYGSGGRLFLGYSKDGINFTFGSKPLANITGTYKSSFYPTFDPVTKKIHIVLWRAMMVNGWQVYHDEFDIRTGLLLVV